MKQMSLPETCLLRHVAPKRWQKASIRNLTKFGILLLATAFAHRLPSVSRPRNRAQIHASALPGFTIPNEVRAFYQHNNYNYSWLDEQHRSDLRQLLVYTGNAALLGLQQTDYHPELCHAWFAGEPVT